MKERERERERATIRIKCGRDLWLSVWQSKINFDQFVIFV
jgi:hypothetical protein